MSLPLPRQTDGFTLLEVICSAAILVILLVLAMSVGGGLRESSNAARCVANLKRIGEGTALYVTENDGLLPHYTPSSVDGSLGYATVGSWYWHLAPYFSIPRPENAASLLGPNKTTGLPEPVVFTCPAQKEEGNASDFKRFFTYPSQLPVSYAPNTRIRGQVEVPWKNEEGRFIAPIRLREIKRPSQKIWLSDSPTPNALNISDYRWMDECAPGNAFPRWAFSRHRGGGNALFFDGHVEWIALSTLRHGDLNTNLRNLFFPFENP